MREDVHLQVAIKLIDTRKLDTQYLTNNLYREAKMLAQIRHPHIVRLYETLKASFLYCLVLEYVPNKDLKTYLDTFPEKRLEESEAVLLLRQVVSALVFLHLRGIVHRDLKMDNILLDASKRNLKIVDFGLSNAFRPGELLKTHCGSPEYAAPELFHDKHDYGAEVDAWSFGIIMYGMVVGCLPFVPGSTEPSKRQALLKMLNKGLGESHAQQMAHLTTDCRGLLMQLIEPKPELRMPMHEVAKHSWITKNGRSPLVINPSARVDPTLKLKVIAKISELNKMDPEVVENAVGEFQYDALSAQYNMLMDRYSALRKGQELSSTCPNFTMAGKESRIQPPSPASVVEGHRQNTNYMIFLSKSIDAEFMPSKQKPSDNSPDRPFLSSLKKAAAKIALTDSSRKTGNNSHKNLQKTAAQHGKKPFHNGKEANTDHPTANKGSKLANIASSVTESIHQQRIQAQWVDSGSCVLLPPNTSDLGQEQLASVKPKVVHLSDSQLTRTSEDQMIIPAQESYDPVVAPQRAVSLTRIHQEIARAPHSPIHPKRDAWASLHTLLLSTDCCDDTIEPHRRTSLSNQILSGK